MIFPNNTLTSLSLDGIFLAKSFDSFRNLNQDIKASIFDNLILVFVILDQFGSFPKQSP